MDGSKTFVLKIKKHTPETISYARLAEYMQKFAQLLGETKSVHHRKITKGSINLAVDVDVDAIPKVNLRLRQIQAGTAAPADLRVAEEIDRMVANDDTSAAIIRLAPDEVMLPFPGATKEKQPVYGPISQASTLDGVVIRVGGQSEPVVQIETDEGIQSYCYVTRDMARDLAKHLYGAELRFFGEGRWIRNEEGKWELTRFSISRFEELEAASLSEVVAELRTLEGRNWADSDPWKELQEMRGTKGSRK